VFGHRKMKVYGLGSNGSGQLGLTHTRDCNIPEECKFSTKLDGKHPDTPAKIVASGNTTYIIFESGRIYQSGKSLSTQHGVSSAFCETTFSQRIRVNFASTTWDACVVATEDRSVYVRGQGPKGELGLGEDTLSEHERRLENFPPAGTEVVDLAGGVAHTVTVLSSGEVYGWGNGRKGQLGEPAGIVWTPRKIEGLDFKVVQAACGREFTFLVGEPSTGRYAILGSDKWGIKSQAPKDVQGWNYFGASWGSIFILDKSGKVISWGRNDHGQLAPTNLPPILYMAVGSEHVVALAMGLEEARNAISWGWGEHGNCGKDVDERGDVKEGRWNNIAIDGGLSARILGVGAGCATSFIWTAN